MLLSDVLDQNGNPTGEKKFIPDTKRSPGSKWYRIFKGHWTDGLMNGHMEMNLMGYCTFAGQFENGQVVSVRNCPMRNVTRQLSRNLFFRES